MEKSNKRIQVKGSIIAIFSVFLLFTGCSSDAAMENPAMEAAGNKISVDGQVAYVVNQHKILVPYAFSGSHSECHKAAGESKLKGCTQPKLPADEINSLPEEVLREIVSLCGDGNGFWMDSSSIYDEYYVAGMVGNHFAYGDDGKTLEPVYGYYEDVIIGTKNLGLLVLYTVSDGFEFTDVEDTANPNYDSNAYWYDSDYSEDEYYSEYEYYDEGEHYDENEYYDDYIIPQSSSKELIYDDIAGLSAWQLMIARNEIFARHGYIFNDIDIRNYFQSKSWYSGYVAAADFDSDVLSEIEIYNINFIKSYE